jgi:hypothetical protein
VVAATPVLPASAGSHAALLGAAVRALEAQRLPSALRLPSAPPSPSAT